MKFFKQNKSETELEEEIENEVIDNNLKQKQTNVSIIKYNIQEDQEIPDIIHICDFHPTTLPSEGSIIWAPNKEQTSLIPYKVIRFDFIEDPEQEINSKIYIVVKEARLTDIIK